MAITSSIIKKLTTAELVELGAKRNGFQFFATKRQFKKRVPNFKQVLAKDDEYAWETESVRCEIIKVGDPRFTTWVFRQYDKINHAYVIDLEPYAYLPFLKA